MNPTMLKGLLGLSVLAACGGKTLDAPDSTDAAPSASAPVQCVPTLGDKAVRHACQHARLGPFVEFVGLSEAERAEDMSQVHHTYQFVMEGDQAPFHGFASFRTARKGVQAFMHPSSVALRFVRNSAVVPAVLALAPDCDRFDVSSVLSAPSGGTYTVEISSAEREFEVFVEHLDAFTGNGAWRARCDD